MKKISILVIIVFCSIYTAHSQELLLYRWVPSDSVKGNWGQNLSHWMHFYGAFGFVTPINQNVGSEIYFGKASNWELGLRYKKRITNWVAIGGNISYDFFNYRMEQNQDKTMPDTLFYDKQKILLHNLSLSPYIRFNFGRRGNKIGNYLDLGIFYNIVLGSAEKQRNTPDGLDRVKNKNLPYITHDYYGFYANIGIGRWVIYGKYNYSAVIIGNPIYNDIAPLTIGLQIGFF